MPVGMRRKRLWSAYRSLGHGVSRDHFDETRVRVAEDVLRVAAPFHFLDGAAQEPAEHHYPAVCRCEVLQCMHGNRSLADLRLFVVRVALRIGVVAMLLLGSGGAALLRA